MAIYSDQTLAERAMRKLMLMGAGDAADAAEAQIVIDKIEGCLSDLATREIYPATDVSGIQPNAFDYVAAVLANYCTSEFGISGETLAKVMTAATTAESRLKTLAYRNPSPPEMDHGVPVPLLVSLF